MIPIFLDANVFFIGFSSPKGISARIFEIAREGKIQIFSTASVLREADRNLRLHADPSAREAFHLFLQKTPIKVVPHPPKDLILQCKIFTHAHDAHVLAGAVAANVRLFFTLDKRHFPREHFLLQNHSAVTILSPADLISKGNP